MIFPVTALLDCTDPEAAGRGDVDTAGKTRWHWLHSTTVPPQSGQREAAREHRPEDHLLDGLITVWQPAA
jgi:hypothetical protein